MPRKTSVALKADRPLAHVIDLETWTKTWSKIKDRPEVEGQKIVWAPNPCYLCSDTYAREADGRDPADKSKPCPACDGSKYGPQYRAYVSRADEILLGGARGGAKSNSAISHLFKGNPHLPQFRKDGQPILVNQSYCHSPHYRGLILRKNAKDLADFISEARKYLKYFGGTWVGGSESCFKFESGALIWAGHLDTAESYEKYLGFNIHRIVIEELTLIPDLETYMKVRTSLRSTREELIPQLLATTNPIGRGLAWVKNRFVKVKRDDGSLYKHGEVIETFVKHKYADRDIRRTRVFFPAYVRDNPHLMKNDDYIGNLVELPEKLRRALLDGDWDILEGAYFDIWRDPVEMALPLTGEPAHACHVITEKKGYPAIKPWAHRAIGGDWGFKHEAANYWGAIEPDTNQIHVYREFVGPKINATDVGIEIAKRSLEDLNQMPSHKLVLWYSPDAFKIGSHDVGLASMASLVAYGISQILGAGNVSMPDFDPTGDQNDMRPGWAQFVQTLNQRKQYGIEIRKANNNRVFGWQYFYNTMNWNPPSVDADSFSMQKFEALFREFGFSAADTYKQAHTKQVTVYPRLQVWERCHRLRQAIPSAIHDTKNNPEDVDKTHFLGMDSLDAARYLIAGLQGEPDDKPVGVLREEWVEAFRQQRPNASLFELYGANLAFEQHQRDEQFAQGMNVGGRASMRRQMLRDLSKGRLN